MTQGERPERRSEATRRQFLRQLAAAGAGVVGLAALGEGAAPSPMPGTEPEGSTGFGGRLGSDEGAQWSEWECLGSPPARAAAPGPARARVTNWSGYVDLSTGGGGLTSRPVLGRDAGPGPLYIFARGADGALWYIREMGDEWSRWASLGGAIVGNIAVQINGVGQMQLFVRGTDNAIYTRLKALEGWRDYQSLGGSLTSDPTIARNRDGRLELFGRGGDGALWHIWQTARNTNLVSPPPWSGWNSLGGYLTSNIAVANNADGRLEVIVRGGDSAFYTRWQTAPNNGWSTSFASFGGGLTSDPSIGFNWDGRLEIFGRGDDASVWHLWQTAPNNGWSDWAPIGTYSKMIGNIAVGRNMDNRLEIFVRDTLGMIKHCWQTDIRTAPNARWSEWRLLGGELASDPVVGSISTRDGLMLRLFAVGMDGHLWTCRQLVPNARPRAG